MRIIIKTIKGEAFPLDVEETTSILEVKQKVKEVKGFEVDTQKLIVKGKNATDDQTLATHNIQEGNFMVLMVQKPKPVV